MSLVALLLIPFANAETVQAPVEDIVEPPVIQTVTPEVYLKMNLEAKGIESAYWVLWQIASCESNWNTNAVGPTQDYGLFQIHLPSHGQTPEYWLNPYNNIDKAIELWINEGTKPWLASKACWG